MDKNKISWELSIFEWEINHYEQSLRTKFINESSQKYLQYQIVNNETQKLKNKVNTILSINWNTSENLIMSSLSVRANDLIRKYETLKEKNIELNWDVLYIYWQMSIILRKRYLESRK